MKSDLSQVNPGPKGLQMPKNRKPPSVVQTGHENAPIEGKNEPQAGEETLVRKNFIQDREPHREEFEREELLTPPQVSENLMVLLHTFAPNTGKGHKNKISAEAKTDVDNMSDESWENDPGLIKHLNSVLFQHQACQTGQETDHGQTASTMKGGPKIVAVR